jgi:hypothetical protein
MKYSRLMDAVRVLAEARLAEPYVHDEDEAPSTPSVASSSMNLLSSMLRSIDSAVTALSPH